MARNRETVSEVTEVAEQTPFEQDTAAKTEKVLSFKVIKNVTLPLLKLDVETPIFVRITGEIFKGKKITGKTTEENSKQAPELMHVFNLESEQPMQMIVNQVLSTELKEQYPESGYVGKCFQFVKHAMQGGKNYATFDIAEIEIS